MRVPENLLVPLFGLYLASGAGFLWFFLTQKKPAAVVAYVLAWAAFLAHTAMLVNRGILGQVLPLSGLYESLLFFAWLIMLIYLLVQRAWRSQVNGVFVLPLVVVLLAGALRLDRSIRPLPPALQSPWLGIHVSLCFLGYACFALSFSFALMYLWQEREVKSRRVDAAFFRLPSLGLLDKFGYRSIIFGFVFLTLGIISGSVWAQTAWGRFWNWDPKETWSLIMWLIYVVYLHGRLIQGWHGRRSAYLAIAGCAAMVFTYLGVSFLLPGLHAYL